jgi:hypothetical protein
VSLHSYALCLKHLETLWLDDGQVFVQVALSENVGKSTKSQKKLLITSQLKLPSNGGIRYMVFPCIPGIPNFHAPCGRISGSSVQECLGSLRSAFDAAERRARAPEARGEVRAV